MIGINSFFFLDSNNLEPIENKLYGYMMDNNCVIESFEQILTGYAELNTYGCYTLVQRKANNIIVSQDYNGSFGLYVFCKDDYFAISNSFLLLVESVKEYGLSIDYDVIRCCMVSDYLSLTYRKTMVNEINILDRNEFISIDIKNKRFKIEKVDHEENQIELDSQTGMDILDAWYKKWTRIIRKLYSENKPMDVDLTGGIDSRLVFSLFLNAGINMKHINVISYKDDLHTHREDYEIASKIAKKYSFEINDKTYEIEDCTMEERIGASLYARIGFHKQLRYREGRNKEKRYRITGGGGEKIRGYWNCALEEVKLYEKYKAKNYFPENSELICESIDLIYNQIFRHLQEKYKLESLKSKEFATYLWNDIADGRHFGRRTVESLLCGEVELQPLSDPMLQRLKLVDGECIDYKLIVAIIFDRYIPDILDIKFDSGHMIAKSTIERAREINNKFPYTKEKVEQLDRGSVYKDHMVRQTEKNASKLANQLIRDSFYSDIVRKSVTEQLTDSLYLSVCIDCETRQYFPLTNVYPLLFVAYLNNEETGSMYEYLLKTSKTVRNTPHQDIWKLLWAQNVKYKDIKRRDDWIMHLYSRWVANPSAVTEYLKENGFKKIGIYGAGRLGKNLVADVLKNGYDVSFIMDRDIYKKIGDYKAIGMDNDLPECDVIIVTIAIGYREVAEVLQKKVKCPVISIGEVINEKRI